MPRFKTGDDIWWLSRQDPRTALRPDTIVFAGFEHGVVKRVTERADDAQMNAATYWVAADNGAATYLYDDPFEEGSRWLCRSESELRDKWLEHVSTHSGAMALVKYVRRLESRVAALERIVSRAFPGVCECTEMSDMVPDTGSCVVAEAEAPASNANKRKRNKK